MIARTIFNGLKMKILPKTYAISYLFLELGTNSNYQNPGNKWILRKYLLPF